MTDSGLPPELRAYLLGNSDSENSKERLRSLRGEFLNWALAEQGSVIELELGPEQAERIKLDGRQKVAKAIVDGDAAFFRNLAAALETGNHFDFRTVKDCVAHVYISELANGKKPSCSKIKKAALNLYAQMQIMMQRHAPVTRKSEADEKLRLPAEIARASQSTNWERTWRELGLKDERYISKGHRGRPKDSKNRPRK